MSMATGGSGANSYATKYLAGIGFLLVLVAAAGTNAYLSVADQLAPDVRGQVLSGILTMIFMTTIGLILLGATIGRESLSSLDILRERAQQMERGNLDVELDTNRSDEIGQLYRSFAAMRDALRQRIGETERQNRRLRDTAGGYSDVMRACANGDLSRRMESDVDNEAMQQIAEDFNEMMDQLETTVAQAQQFTDAVSGATNDLSAQTEQAMQASMRINGAAQEIDEGRGASPLSDLDELKPSADAATGTNAPQPAEDGTIETDETVESIEELKRRMNRIDEVTEFISEVADETNMLALNAGIEASKVEEGAEGFEVVADEIKSLAEETQDSAGEIEQITERVRSGTNEAVESILRQQAALLLVMNRQAEELSDASRDLNRSLNRLSVSDAALSGSNSSDPDPDPDTDRDRREALAAGSGD